MERGLSMHTESNIENSGRAVVDYKKNEYSVYGKSVAINFKVSNDRNNTATLFVEVARVYRDGSVRADWKNKSSFQLNADKELVQMAKLLINREMNEIDFQWHGRKKNKMMKVRNEKDGVFILINDGERLESDRTFSAKLPDYSKFHIATLLVKALSSRYNVSDGTVIAMLRL